MVKEDINMKITDHIKDKISVENVTTYYQLAKLYKLKDLAQVALNYIERCFTMVVESKNFLELDYSIVGKILGSSELNVYSEIEVFSAANQ